MDMSKKQKKEGQQRLDGVFQKVSPPKEFAREGILKAVAEFVVCDDQVSDTYQNGWVTLTYLLHVRAY